MKTNHDITQKQRVVKGVPVDTVELEVTNANIMALEVGTTGFKGGDAGHGGRTFIAFKDLGGTSMNANVKQDRFGCEEIEIEFGGDSELQTLIDSLEFAVKVLKDRK